MPGPEFQERSFDCVPRPPNCGGKENARDFAQADGQMIGRCECNSKAAGGTPFAPAQEKPTLRKASLVRFCWLALRHGCS
jgi:hypothetical protein